MKNFKRFTAAIAATLMAASLSIPMATSFAASTDTPITITIGDTVGEGNHTYTAYPIFTGKATKADAAEVPTLESPAWANSNGASALVEAILADTTICPFKDGSTTEYAENSVGALLKAAKDKAGSGVPDAAAVVKALSGIQSDSAEAKALAKVIVKQKDNVGSAVTAENNAISITQDGYYVIVDELATGQDEAKNTVISAYILSVVGNEDLEIAPKAALPTIDKQIKDNDDSATTGDNNGYGETADHAIGEEHDFKLTAKIPANDAFKEYDTYKLVFNDTMSKGLDFGEITSVTVKSGDKSKTLTANTEYTKTEISKDEESGSQTWSLTIDDVISNLPEGIEFGTAEITVEVIYTAKLNADATSYDASSTSGNAKDNKNTVYLEYSNNPNSNGLGKTNEDEVYDYCYTVKNIKRKNSTSGDVLEGAEFELKKGGTAINFVWNADKNAYVPAADGTEGSSTTIKSQSDGKFNIIGLDAGTYTLTETKAPEGYNKAVDTTVEIKATHSETSADTPAMVLSNDSKGMDNTIVDTSGSTLPSTGGIGTTLFYIGGGSMVAVAGIFLITKKRMGKKAE